MDSAESESALHDGLEFANYLGMLDNITISYLVNTSEVIDSFQNIRIGTHGLTCSMYFAKKTEASLLSREPQQCYCLSAFCTFRMALTNQFTISSERVALLQWHPCFAFLQWYGVRSVLLSKTDVIE